MTKNWSRADTETLAGTFSFIQLVDALVSSIDKIANEVLDHLISSGNTNLFHRFGTGGVTDAGNNYASRRSIDGAATTGNTNSTAPLEGIGTATNRDKFDWGHFCNLATELKLCYFWHIDAAGTNSSVAPDRAETCFKWEELSLQSNVVEVRNGGAGDYIAPSEQDWFTTVD